MVSYLICIVGASRRRGTSLRSEIANREDPYVVAVNILSKFRMNKNTLVNDLFKLTLNLLSFALL